MVSSMSDTRPALVFDAGGVLEADHAMAKLLDVLAKQTDKDPQPIAAEYQSQLRDRLSSGHLSEHELWDWVRAKMGVPTTDEHLHDLILEMLTALPAVKALPNWAESARLRLLSNHFAPWLRPRLRAEGIEDLFEPDGIFVSSETGLLKPDPRAFKQAFKGLVPARILYIDDKPSNLRVASQLGASTLEAEPTGQWSREVDTWIVRHG